MHAAMATALEAPPAKALLMRFPGWRGADAASAEGGEAGRSSGSFVECMTRELRQAGGSEGSAPQAGAGERRQTVQDQDAGLVRSAAPRIGLPGAPAGDSAGGVQAKAGADAEKNSPDMENSGEPLAESTDAIRNASGKNADENALTRALPMDVGRQESESPLTGQAPAADPGAMRIPGAALDGGAEDSAGAPAAQNTGNHRLQMAQHARAAGDRRERQAVAPAKPATVAAGTGGVSVATAVTAAQTAATPGVLGNPRKPTADAGTAGNPRRAAVVAAIPQVLCSRSGAAMGISRAGADEGGKAGSAKMSGPGQAKPETPQPSNDSANDLQDGRVLMVARNKAAAEPHSDRFAGSSARFSSENFGTAGAPAAPVQTAPATAMGASAHAGALPAHAEAARAAGSASSAWPGAAGVFDRIDAAPLGGARVLSSTPRRLEVGLHDASLGWVEVRAHTAAGEVAATVSTASATAHAALTAALPSMRASLAGQSVRVETQFSQTSSSGGGQGNPSQQGREAPPGGTGTEARSASAEAIVGQGETETPARDLSWIDIRV